jgi:hypothetical protein
VRHGRTYSTECAISRHKPYPFVRKGFSALMGPPDNFRYLPEPILFRRFRSSKGPFTDCFRNKLPGPDVKTVMLRACSTFMASERSYRAIGPRRYYVLLKTIRKGAAWKRSRARTAPPTSRSTSTGTITTHGIAAAAPIICAVNLAPRSGGLTAGKRGEVTSRRRHVLIALTPES